MIDIGSQASSGQTNSTSNGWDLNPFDEDELLIENSEEKLDILGGLGGLGKVSTEDTSAELKNIEIANLFGLKTEEKESADVPGPDSTFQLHNFNAPDKDSEVTFIAILFFIEHFFLFLFIVMRDMLKKRKSEADIFLERRAYKRKIKKNLPKDVLALVTAGMLINKYFLDQDTEKGTNLFSKLVEKVSENSKDSPNNERQPEAKVETEKPKLQKKSSEMSGDTFLME